MKNLFVLSWRENKRNFKESLREMWVKVNRNLKESGDERKLKKI